MMYPNYQRKRHEARAYNADYVPGQGTTVDIEKADSFIERVAFAITDFTFPMFIKARAAVRNRARKHLNLTSKYDGKGRLRTA